MSNFSNIFFHYVKIFKFNYARAASQISINNSDKSFNILEIAYVSNEREKLKTVKKFFVNFFVNLSNPLDKPYHKTLTGI